MTRRTWTYLLALLGVACADPAQEAELELASSALSACEEMVPANRFIDGIPAYAQCAASENSAIFSNNGVDTSTTQMGPDWVRTQHSGGYQCTELAKRYLHFVWNVRYSPRGNAGQWCDTPPPADSGLVQSMTPSHGDLMVLAPGSCGAAQTTGHVTVVDTVDMAGGKVSVVEQNRARRGSYMISCAKCYLHVVANDGTTPARRPMAPDGGSLVPPVGDPPRGDAGTSPPRPNPLRDAAAPKPAPDASVPAEPGNTARDAARPTTQADAGRGPSNPPVDGDDDATDPDEDADDDGPTNGDDEGEDESDDEASADEEDSGEGCSLASRGSSPQTLLWLLLGMIGYRRRPRP